MKYLSSVGGGILTAFLSGFTAYQLSQDSIPCYVLLGTATVLLVLGICQWEKDKTFAVFIWIAVACCGFFSIKGLVAIGKEKEDHVVWMSFLDEMKDSELDRLKSLADQDDGPAQYELARYYFDAHDFKNAREYAHKAANNGNIDGYIMLITSYLKGIGCNRDIHHAVSLMKKAQQTDYSNFVHFWEDIKGELSTDELEGLESSRQRQIALEAICKEIVTAIDEKGEDEGRKVIQSYQKELELFSELGYIPATEYIYIEECYRNDRDSIKLKTLTHQLYQAGHIPTSPLERAVFFGFLRGEKKYDDRDFQRHIQDHNYAFVAYGRIFQLLLGFEGASDEHLVRDYQLRRSQYEEMKRYASGEKKSLSFHLSLDNNHNDNLDIAKSMLGEVINEIEKRKLSPGKSEADTTCDYLISHGVTISILNHK